MNATVFKINPIPWFEEQPFSFVKHYELVSLAGMENPKYLFSPEIFVEQLFLKTCQTGILDNVIYMLNCNAYKNFIFKNYEILTKATILVNERIQNYLFGSAINKTLREKVDPYTQVNCYLHRYLEAIVYNDEEEIVYNNETDDEI